jgi:hypothetical protein
MMSVFRRNFSTRNVKILSDIVGSEHVSTGESMLKIGFLKIHKINLMVRAN